MTEIIRSFLAIELPQSNKEEVLELIQRTKRTTPAVIKWVSRENLHITLKFLGKFEKKHTEILRTCLEEKMQAIRSFQIAIDSLGAFPNLPKPKVIWLGLERPDSLTPIFRQIEDCVTCLGYEPDDRPFSPHLTIGRIRRDTDFREIREAGQALSSRKFDLLSKFMVDKVSFFQSELTREGPIYTNLFDVSLAT